MRSNVNGVTSARNVEEGLDARSLVSLLRQRAAEMGEKEAFCYLSVDGGQEERLTYRALHERAMAIGGELQRSASQGDRALLLFPTGLDFVCAFFGCLYAGVVAVPVAPAGRNRFAWAGESIFEAAKPAIVLSTTRHCERAAESYAPGALLDRPWIAVDRIDADHQRDWRDPQLEGCEPAFLQYTSGSTSAPKGVVLTHRNLLCNAALIRQIFGNTPESRAVFWLPLYHDMGLIGGVIQPIYCGGSCSLLAPTAFLQRPALWLETISRKRATVAGGPDFAFDLCARKIRPEDREGLDLSSWNVAFVGAESIRARTLERFSTAFASNGFRREAFLPCYGLAEATLMVSGGPRQTGPTVIQVRADALARHRVEIDPRPNGPSRQLVACGEHLPGQRVVIVDPRTRRPCDDDAVGEVWVQGPSVACGYYERPDVTAVSFGARLAGTDEGPFLRTGDIGFLRGGQLFVTGRLKDLIIIRGRNLYPEDIEYTVERACDGLRLGYGVAFSVEHDDNERLVIVHEVEPRQRHLDIPQALEAIRQAVAARHEVEVYAVVLVKAGNLLKTSSGKTRRSACREQFLSGRMEVLGQWTASLDDAEDEHQSDDLEPSSRKVTVHEVESWLTQRIAARLRISHARVAPSTPFLEMGMSSLDAMEIAGDLERWLGRTLSPTAIYNYPSISALARWLAAQSAASHAPPDKTASRLTGSLDLEQFDAHLRQMTAEEMEQFVSIAEQMTQEKRQ